MSALTVLICTHNRVELLQRAIRSLNAARRPTLPVQILVAANACTDDTAAQMRAYQAHPSSNDALPLRVIEPAQLQELQQSGLREILRKPPSLLELGEAVARHLPAKG